MQYETCVCPTCGRPHRKRKVVDTRARARAAASARWAAGPLDDSDFKEGQRLTTELMNERVEKVVRATSAIQRGLPRLPKPRPNRDPNYGKAMTGDTEMSLTMPDAPQEMGTTMVPRRGSLCEHGRERKHCRIGTCGVGE